MNESVKERLKTFIEHKGLSIRAFEKECGFSYGFVGNMRTSMQPDKTMRIAQCFPDLNTGWLMTGKGNMLVDMGGFEEVPDEEIVNLNPRPGDKFTLIPLINIDSVGGMDSTNDLSWRDQFTIRHIPFIDAQKDDVAIFQSGDSMTPAIPSGSILQIRQVHDWQEYFGYGDTFVLWLKDNRRLTKQVLKYSPDPKNYVTCHSFNPEYADEELPRKFIRQVWKVISILSGKGW